MSVWMVSAFARPVELPQAPAQGFDLLLVGVFLALGQLKCLEDLLHVVQRVPQRVDDVIDLFNRPLHRRG